MHVWGDINTKHSKSQKRKQPNIKRIKLIYGHFFEWAHMKTNVIEYIYVERDESISCIKYT